MLPHRARPRAREGHQVQGGASRALRRYTDEELAEVYDLYADEDVRGANPRYWDDVTEGEALPTMAKGPMTVTGFIAYAQGWGGLYIRANKLAWRLIDAHPGSASRTASASPTARSACTGKQDFALEVGAPGAYDYGPERCSWLTHHLTNWMGDDGFLRQRALQDPPPQSGGRPTCSSRAASTRKFVEDGRHLVEIEQEAHNQDDEQSVVGGGVVELPSRA